MSTLLLFILLFCSSSLKVMSLAGRVDDEKNPFTPKAFAMRYWDKAIRNNIPKPSFLISKASPLTTVQAAKYANLAATSALPAHLPEFCSAAHLLCFPGSTASKPSLLEHRHHGGDGEFSSYETGKNFTSYGTDGAGTSNSFKNYSDWDGFRQYSRSSGGGSESFGSYGVGDNVVVHTFNSYGKNAGGGSGGFDTYTDGSNAANAFFVSYSEGAAGREQKFSHYSDGINIGVQNFSSYGKSAAGAKNGFDSYSKEINIVDTAFANYGEGETGANDTFTNYGEHSNDTRERFKNYAAGSEGAAETFKKYGWHAGTSTDSFESYAKDSKGGAKVGFTNYRTSSFLDFKGYAKNATANPKVGFTGYSTFITNATFKDYKKDAAVSFANYANTSRANLPNQWVEPGKFFREKMLKEGTVMPMPDIRDKMPERSFLPRSILTKLSFSTSEMKRVFKASDGSLLDKMISDSVRECEREPSRGETKRCVGSIEDMLDFATSVVGRHITVRTTQNVNGSNQNVMVGQVKGVNGGKLTKSVSCHQSLFPYLLYYCHSVPKVRVYEADLLDPTSKAKINHGVAICHIDTSAWSPTHGAFLALGSGPGRIEVCHWIFENDMTWTIAN